jgi:hypothetical protein
MYGPYVFMHEKGMLWCAKFCVQIKVKNLSSFWEKNEVWLMVLSNVLCSCLYERLEKIDLKDMF